MSLRTGLILQSVCACLQAIIPSIPGLPEEWQKFAHLALGALAVLMHRIASYSNPDGTPAGLPYREDVTGQAPGERRGL